MSISFDTSASSTSATPISYTVGAGTNPILVVIVYENGGPNVTGVTYNGVAMTQFATNSVGVAFTAWYLLNPTQGSAFSIVVTGGTVIETLAASYFGAVTAVTNSQVLSSNANNNNLLAFSLTTVKSGSWLGSGYFIANSTTQGFSGDISSARQAPASSGLCYGDSNGSVVLGARSVSAGGAGADAARAGVLFEIPSITVFSPTASVAILNGASRTFTTSKSLTKQASLSIFRAASRSIIAGRVYMRTLSDSFMNAASRLMTVLSAGPSWVNGTKDNTTMTNEPKH